MHKPSCEARAGRGSRARHTGGDVTPRAGQDSPVMSRWPQPWVFMLTAGQPSENRLRVTSQLSRSALHPEQATSPSPCLSLLSYTMGRAQSNCGDYKVSQHSRPATLTLLLSSMPGALSLPPKRWLHSLPGPRKLQRQLKDGRGCGCRVSSCRLLLPDPDSNLSSPFLFCGPRGVSGLSLSVCIHMMG